MSRRRNQRTVFLAILAAASFAWMAIYQFDVPAEEIGWMLVYCVIGVAAIVLLAAITVGLMVGMKRLLGRD